jgi:hypothetical protein
MLHRFGTAEQPPGAINKGLLNPLSLRPIQSRGLSCISHGLAHLKPSNRQLSSQPITPGQLAMCIGTPNNQDGRLGAALLDRCVYPSCHLMPQGFRIELRRIRIR